MTPLRPPPHDSRQHLTNNMLPSRDHKTSRRRSPQSRNHAFKSFAGTTSTYCRSNSQLCQQQMASNFFSRQFYGSVHLLRVGSGRVGSGRVGSGRVGGLMVFLLLSWLLLLLLLLRQYFSRVCCCCANIFPIFPSCHVCMAHVGLSLCWCCPASASIYAPPSSLFPARLPFY